MTPVRGVLSGWCRPVNVGWERYRNERTWATLSNFTELIERARSVDPDLARDLENEVRDLNSQRKFGLVFERHLPESVNLPGRKVRRGSRVRMLPPRRETTKMDPRVWTVKTLDGDTATLRFIGTDKQVEETEWPVEDLVAVAEFNDTIYPGLVPDGEVNGGDVDDPAHVVINAENYHALEMLTYTHRHSIDAIYIDPPYNTGAKDWKYNNDYVDGNDGYRHSKWLSFMERRLKIAKDLLNPKDSVLIVTIDEKEYHRLAMLLEQVFPESQIQMVSSVINPKGASRAGAFARVDEYLFFVRIGESKAAAQQLSDEWKISEDKRAKKIRWAELLRSGSNYLRVDSDKQFYPVFVREGADGPEFAGVGEPYFGNDLNEVVSPEGTYAVWPIRKNGDEGNWQISADNLRRKISDGYAKLGRWRGGDTTIYYLKRGEESKVKSGFYSVIGRSSDNSVVISTDEVSPQFVPGTQWRIESHNAEQGGTGVIQSLLGNRKFTYPKSLYAVEDALRFFVKDKPDATILDFFSGSGTTAHAVMRLNKQDGGRRRSISVTNNEVSADEQKALTAQGLRPGDEEWEALGIANYVTKPRVKAAITGKTPDGDDIKGSYKFTDEFPMKDGFAANAKFFTLTYEDPLAIQLAREFRRIAPLLWLRAGQQGPVVDDLTDKGYGVSDYYGVIESLDYLDDFIAEVEDKRPDLVYIITDDRRQFQHVAGLLPSGIDTVRLYESYLTNFEVNTGRYA